MNHYRWPTEILWINNGWGTCDSPTDEQALRIARSRGSNVNMSNLQIQVGARGWKNVVAWRRELAEMQADINASESRETPSHERPAP